MNIPSRHIALVGLLVAVPISAWFICYRPMNIAVLEAANEVRARTSLLSSYAEVNRQHRVIKSITNSLEKVQEEASDRIPHEQDAQQWLESASDAATDLGLLVRSVTTSGERDYGEYRILPVDLHMTGQFASVYKLLQHLERMDRMSKVDRLTIHQEENDLVDARLVINLVFAAGGDE